MTVEALESRAAGLTARCQQAGNIMRRMIDGDDTAQYAAEDWLHQMRDVIESLRPVTAQVRVETGSGFAIGRKLPYEQAVALLHLFSSVPSDDRIRLALDGESYADYAKADIRAARLVNCR